jgi:hypothetical protein
MPANRLRREVEKRRQTLDPLVQELAPMHEHQRIDAALGDQPGSDDCLAERRRGGQDTSVVLQHRLGREFLLCSELALKGGLQRVSAETLVTDDRANIQVDQYFSDVFETSAWQADVLWMFFSATDDPWLRVGRQAHRLGLIELRILERGDTQQSVSKTRQPNCLWRCRSRFRGLIRVHGEAHRQSVGPSGDATAARPTV